MFYFDAKYMKAKVEIELEFVLHMTIYLALILYNIFIT